MQGAELKKKLYIKLTEKRTETILKSANLNKIFIHEKNKMKSNLESSAKK